MHSRRANPPLCTTGVPHTPTLPPILRPSVLARCARCIIRNSFLLRFRLRSSHCPVDSHHDCVFSFRVRGGVFHVVIALQRIVMTFLKASLVQRTRVKINSVSLLLHLGFQIHRLRSELMPPTATVVAAETFFVSDCWYHTAVAAENS